MARSFVSRFLAERLIAGPPLVGPELERCRGAVLLTDIEGFTAHVEGLTVKGSSGLEALAVGFNAYFAALVDAVIARCGDVLMIAGDSFLCWWPAGPKGDVASAARRAADAGVAIQQTTAHFGDAGAVVPPTRLGLAAGELTVGIVGGHEGRWELVPGGPAIAQAALNERGARAGTVTLDRSTLDLLGSDAQTRPVGPDRFELRAVDSPPASPMATSRADGAALARLMPFVPAPVLHWGPSDPDWLADRRPVTAIMASLETDEAAGQDGLQHHHLAIRAFQKAIRRFEGASKLLFDNKGLTCSGVFGLPPRAHEDDLDRGLRAARAVNEAFSSPGLRCAIGVASGRVFCGVFGTAERREYTLFGDVVNLASRLSASSTSDVLIDGATVQASSLIMEVERRPMLAIKGRRDPVQVQRLVELRSAEPGGRAIVGRDAERSVVSEGVDRLMQDGQRATLVIEGAAGMGKTTLAGEAVALAAHRGARSLRMVADPVEGATPYGPWRGLFRELLGEARSDEELLGKLMPEEDAVNLLPLLNAVLSTPLPDTPTTSALSGDARADRTDALLAGAVLKASGQAPIVLLVEDAHWLDSNSLALLLRVISSAPRLLTVITERPPPVDEDLASDREQIRGLRHTRLLSLGPLSPEGMRALVCQRLGTPTVSPRIISEVQERVAGHPFFCEAVLETMVQTGVIRVSEAGAQLAEGAAMRIPASIESPVLSRLDRTAPEVQLALKAAAVVGSTFTVAEVAAARAAAPETITAQLEVLCSAQLIAADQPGPDAGYGFRHRIIRDATYELLTESQRRPLHRGLVRFYETTLPSGERASHPELLAHHWRRADEPERALPYLDDAGRRALREGGFDEAVALLGQAIALAPYDDPSHRAMQEKSLADAHYFRGDLLRSRALLEQALERLGEPVPSGRRALAASVLRDVLAQGRQLLRPGRYRGARARERPVLVPAVDAYRTLVQISYLHATSTLEVMHLVLAGLNVGEQVGPSPELARALANAACLADIARCRRLGDRYGRRAVRIAEHHDHSPASAYVWNVLAIMHAQRGHLGGGPGRQRSRPRALRGDRRLQPGGRAVADALGAGALPRRAG